MNMCEALRLGRRENRAIKRSDWPSEVYVYHGMDNLLRIIGDGSGYRELTLSAALLMYDDWELSAERYHGPLETLSEEEATLTEIISVSQLPGYRRISHGDEWERYAIDGEEYFDTSCGCAGIYSKGRYVCRTEKELIGIVLERRAQFLEKQKAAESEITSVRHLPGYEQVASGANFIRFNIMSPKLSHYTYIYYKQTGAVCVYPAGYYEQRRTEREFIAHILAQLAEEPKT